MSLVLSTSLCYLLASVCLLEEASILCGLTEAAVLLIECLYILYCFLQFTQRKTGPDYCIIIDVPLYFLMVLTKKNCFQILEIDIL